MHFPELHSWALDYVAAIQLQKELAAQVVVKNCLPARIRTVAGVDVSYRKHGDHFFAAVVLLSYPELEVIETRGSSARVTFPYIPGLLSFRELPVLLQAFRRLNTVPDLILVDGQGIAHQRRCGLAAHLGLWLDVPTIGCAKSRLVGEFDEPGQKRGASSPLVHQGEEIGMVLRSRDRVKPLFVSPGHRVDTVTAGELVLACCKGYRMPEPTRIAHHETNRLRREDEARHQPA